MRRVEDAAAAHDRLGDKPALAVDLGLLSTLALASHDRPAARRYAGRAVTAAHEAGDPDLEISARVELARLESQGADWSAAAKTLKPAVSLVLRSGTPAEQVRLLLLAAEVSSSATDQTTSRDLLARADRIAQRATTAPCGRW